MLYLLFASIFSVIFTMGMSHVAEPKYAHQILAADGTVHPCPTFDMLVSSDVAYLYA